MKTIFAVFLVCAFTVSSEANAQYPVYLNRGSVQYGCGQNYYGYSRGPTTYYFNGGRQPAYWSYQSRYGRVRNETFFRGNRVVGNIYRF